MDSNLLIIALLLIAGAGLKFGFSGSGYSAVLRDLRSNRDGAQRVGAGEPEEPTNSSPSKMERGKKKDYGAQVLFGLGGIFLGVAFALLLSASPGKTAIPFGVVGGAIGLIVGERRKANAVELIKRRTEFFLPVVMERLVMSAEAGLDILPAIKATIAEDEELDSDSDPVTEKLKEVVSLTESGLSFEDALRSIAEKSDSSALRHSFIHLGLAHNEGGELIGPLRELSDATQLYYQESVEEEIAKMPVKATMPLLCTFAGLLVLFLATPLIQIIETLKAANP